MTLGRGAEALPTGFLICTTGMIKASLRVVVRSKWVSGLIQVKPSKGCQAQSKSLVRGAA